MTIVQIHEFLRDLISKEQKGYFTPTQIDTALDRGQMRVFKNYLPLYAYNTEAQDALSPFKRVLTYSTDVAGAYNVAPEETFQALIGMGIQYSDGGVIRTEGIHFPGEDALSNRLNSQLRKPTQQKPIGEVVGIGKFLLYPAAVYAGTIRFIRRPKAPYYSFVQVGRSVTYQDGSSVQLEWGERYQDEVILAALTYLGINLSDDKTIQISEALSKLK